MIRRRRADYRPDLLLYPPMAGRTVRPAAQHRWPSGRPDLLP
ncbi:hypothetical protein [Streptomyces chartreusis]